MLLQKGPAALTDCSPGRKAELLRALPRVRNRPESHAHAGALQEANPSRLTGQPDPEVYQEEAGRGEWMVRGSGSPLLRPEPGYLTQSTRHENAGQTLPSQTRGRPLASVPDSYLCPQEVRTREVYEEDVKESEVQQ